MRLRGKEEWGGGVVRSGLSNLAVCVQDLNLVVQTNTHTHTPLTCVGNHCLSSQTGVVEGQALGKGRSYQPGYFLVGEGSLSNGI